MLKLVSLLMVVICLSGCGLFNRGVAKITGHAKSCVDGVQYLQFASGVTVSYNRDGSVKNC